MIAPEPIHPFPWRICAAAALFTVLMVAAAVAANIFTISGNGKLPLMVPGLLALGWLIWEAMRLARGVPGSAIARYIGRVVPLMIANIVTVVAAITSQREWHPAGVLAVLVALLPAPPLIGFIWAMGRLLVEESDEYLRMVHARRALIAAGFESGHAYGKSLRTVKSCVGSTWCRYGVGDSAGLAVELENRYKGLRAPHKIKFGVSGCTRECAEAQGKDIGVIATEKGWNLYVCGNGGMKPRHAELLASDLSQQELVRLIDRLLMFYVRTADRLQRTSTWRENLEGGLDYLKDVLQKDSLGLCAELESQMQNVVNTYQCEWKAAVTDPETRKRFRSFVNSDQADENVLFVEERGQIRPARADERGPVSARVIPIRQAA